MEQNHQPTTHAACSKNIWLERKLTFQYKNHRMVWVERMAKSKKIYATMYYVDILIPFFDQYLPSILTNACFSSLFITGWPEQKHQVFRIIQVQRHS